MGNVVLVWAWWTGMSGVAGILHDLWYTNIVAIDACESELTNTLKAKGIKTIIGHGKYEIHKDDTVIYSAAVAESTEVQAARALRKTNRHMIICNYFEFLWEISKYFISIGTAGTNGKSSTTALAISTAKKVLPSFGLGILWALVPDLENNSYAINHKKQKQIKAIFDYILHTKRSHELQHQAFKYIKTLYFFVEACEYKRHFLHLDLDYALITSLELDHTDYYKDMNDYKKAFQQLFANVKQGIRHPKWLKIKSLCKTSRAKILEVTPKAIPFKHIWGKHNDTNGSLVMGLLNELIKASKDPLKASVNAFKSLTTFKWLWRRMELLGENKNWTQIFSDYGHMASSLTLGYETLKEKFPKQKLICIFQPHQINRIVTWRNDFIQSTKGYDEVIIYDIYAARENLSELVRKVPALKGITTLKELGNKFAQACKGTYIDNFDTIIQRINDAGKWDIIVVYSAGDIDFLLRRNPKVFK